MNKPLAGKVALVTGGSRGLGAATVRLLAEQGADVAFTYVSSEKKAQAVVDEVRARGAKVAAFKSDQADMGQAPALIDDVVAHFGGLDILVNNAAISVGQGRTVDDPDADTAELDRMHATNYLGVIAVIRAASRVLREGGRVITVSSGFGTRPASRAWPTMRRPKRGSSGTPWVSPATSAPGPLPPTSWKPG